MGWAGGLHHDDEDKDEKDDEDDDRTSKIPAAGKHSWLAERAQPAGGDEKRAMRHPAFQSTRRRPPDEAHQTTRRESVVAVVDDLEGKKGTELNAAWPACSPPALPPRSM